MFRQFLKSTRALPAILLLICLGFSASKLEAQDQPPKFHVIAFYTGKDDLAHISFVNEANKWFPANGAKHGFSYDSTNDWSNLNAAFLSHYQVVMFLDTRPEDPAQRAAFQKYMEDGGAWMGFHFSAFALTPSAYPQNWDWYHEDFLGSGQYVSNTWRPVSTIFRVEDHDQPSTHGLPDTFRSAPCEWYRWSNDLRTNANIKILVSLDPSAFPVGTGPKPYEIWHSGYYPIVWTNTKYRMIYFNFGHNDMDYEDGSNIQLSSTFSSKSQNQMILNSLLWLGKARSQHGG